MGHYWHGFNQIPLLIRGQLCSCGLWHNLRHETTVFIQQEQRAAILHVWFCPAAQMKKTLPSVRFSYHLAATESQRHDFLPAVESCLIPLNYLQNHSQVSINFVEISSSVRGQRAESWKSPPRFHPVLSLSFARHIFSGSSCFWASEQLRQQTETRASRAKRYQQNLYICKEICI